MSKTRTVMQNRIQRIRRRLNSVVASHRVYKEAAKEAHRGGWFSEWSRLMRECKNLKRQAKVLSHWMHQLMYSQGQTRVAPKRDKTITAGELISILERESIFLKPQAD